MVLTHACCSEPARAGAASAVIATTTSEASFMSPYNAYSPRVVSAGTTRAARLAVLVAALGYFVDIYDLILFGMVRKTSLLGLGACGDLAPASAACKEILTDDGVFLLNMQMGG